MNLTMKWIIDICKATAWYYKRSTSIFHSVTEFSNWPEAINAPQLLTYLTWLGRINEPRMVKYLVHTDKHEWDIMKNDIDKKRFIAQ